MPNLAQAFVAICGLVATVSAAVHLIAGGLGFLSTAVAALIVFGVSFLCMLTGIVVEFLGRKSQ